ncbi:MAG: cyclic nucleotide-binding/CBS domain-containing protein [Candidatus Hodarchaeota archaeon]
MIFTVKNLMYTEFPTAYGKITVTEAAQVLTHHGRSFMVLVQDDHPLGVVTEQDFVRKVLAKGLDPDMTKIAEIMSHPLITINPDADLSEAAELIKKTGIHKVVVVDENQKLLGVITARLLARHFNDYVDKVTRDIIRHASFAHFSL